MIPGPPRANHLFGAPLERFVAVVFGEELARYERNHTDAITTPRRLVLVADDGVAIQRLVARVMVNVAISDDKERAIRREIAGIAGAILHL